MENDKQTNGNGHSRTTAIEIHRAKVAPLDAYQPRDFMEAMKIAETLAKSKLFGVKSPEEVFVIMSTGAELGLSPTASLRGIFTINNKPGLYADTMVAVCINRPECEYFRCVESTDKSATYEGKRRGNPARRNTFTIEQAKRAGVTKNATYQAWTEDMLRHRAAAALARELFPDLLLGLYCREELEGIGNAQADEAPPAPEPREVEVLEAQTVEPEESMEDALTRWTQAFVDAKTAEECDRIAAEVQARGVSADDMTAFKKMYSDAKKRIKAAQ